MKKLILNYWVIAALVVAAVFTSCGGGSGSKIGKSSGKIKMTTEKGGNFYLYLTGSGVATVDWGDGSEKTTLTLKSEYLGSGDGVFIHTYPSASLRTITMNGDNITGLLCRENITSLDVTRCTELTELHCDNNRLTSLDVSKNTALKSLICYSNQLTSLDLSKNTALTSLSCGYNKLTRLDVSKNTVLSGLDCDNNQLTSLDVSKNNALIGLRCANNQLTKLDVSKNNALMGLGCSNNQLTSLDVNKNRALTQLYCANNQLTSLDVNNNSALKGLNIRSNQLTATALNTLFGTLHSNPPEQHQSKEIDINDNPGTNSCDRSIAERNRWVIRGLVDVISSF